jgi:hypothetical protein
MLITLAHADRLLLSPPHHRAIASCPRLPAADWAALATRISRTEAARAWGAAAAELQAAALQLALRHAAAGGLGLATALEEVTKVPARVRQLLPAARLLLLQQLPQLLRCLPSGRIATLLQVSPAADSQAEAGSFRL